ncbi:RluA family pseudouridine synthase [Sphingobacterium sp. DN00404]|uniref:RluA family pseudouridine synthase n=1 Tax=Sphingobacterium micropteri TaxID=2763501 RepID=A0ABR7YJI9_9SPHI|nr:RluA family pseudouridine synthase [Sphingobacterium micropteri]MBD1431493.1 RluA family pseudouridine synthase [Sphingobacterium micropteri]
MVVNNPLFFHHFQSDIAGIPKPEAFTFPFCYEADALSKIAVIELQKYLEEQQDFVHNFGLQNREGFALGKMFGVLVVESENGQLGYLAACSGKLAGTNQHTYFVPPIFDMLTKESFFLQEEEQINALNRQIENLENAPDLPKLIQQLKEIQQQADEALKVYRLHMKTEKAKRKKIRAEHSDILSETDYQLLETDLIKQSYRDQHEYAVLKDKWKTQLQSIEELIQHKQQEIEDLKNTRKLKSAVLQQRLFERYQFLNARAETKSLLAIFAESKQTIPPAGAGECAAPKLLQYAYQHKLKPICMAEFWWGVSPASEIRKHKNFYPACKSKCEPILSHMLKGLHVAPDPMRINPAQGRTFDIIHEDEDIIVINKPAEFLSVPGIHVHDSVYTRILAQYPEISGPVIIHRLDMSTSGLLILAKHKTAHQFIQKQFIQHTVVKRYTAILDGILTPQTGIIDLPLRVDLDDRPRQVVCYQYGKPAKTKFDVLGYEDGYTRIHLFPLTGRTHQLRVHAAHHQGLHIPILGDDLYGQRADRLHLHAGYIQFVHPRTGKHIAFTAEDPF